jgi:fructose-specific component phosphotransferase system IIB-like protein
MRKLDVIGKSLSGAQAFLRHRLFEAAAAKVSIQEQLRPGRAARKQGRADWSLSAFDGIKNWL